MGTSTGTSAGRINALDTTTGHGVDSFLSADDEWADPWAEKCTVMFIDGVVNHTTTLLPLWSAEALANVDDRTLPVVMREARRRELVTVASGATAEDFALTGRQSRALMKQFTGWAGPIASTIQAWARYHLETQRIQTVRRHSGPWSPEGRTVEFTRLRRQLPTIPDEELWFSYQTFTRAVQYADVIGGDVPYFPHPIRSRAFLQESPGTQFSTWSWGAHVVQLVKAGHVRRRTGDVLDLTARLREATLASNASFHDLVALSPRSRKERILDVAVAARLPVAVKPRVVNTIAETLEGSAILLAPFEPVATYILGAGSFLVRRWTGKAPARIARVPFVRGLIHLVETSGTPHARCPA